MQPQALKEALANAQDSVERQILEAELSLLLNEHRWFSLEKEGGAIRAQVAKERAQQRLGLASLRHGLKRIQEVYADDLAWEPEPEPAPELEPEHKERNPNEHE